MAVNPIIRGTKIWEDGVLQVKVPLPFPLRWVNGYILRGQQGFTVIDPGLHTKDAETIWEQTLDENGIGFGDIEQVVLTHHHPDHYGMAGWFQERSHTPVRMSAAGYDQVKQLWRDGMPITQKIADLFQKHGLTGEPAERLVPHLDSFVPLVSPQPEVAVIEPGAAVQLGSRTFETIHTPGHAEGHLCFYDRERRHMFCGDHVLPQISPNVSYIPGFDENPLKSFLDSLRDMQQYETDKAYPGHREPFASFVRRAGELIAHHDERLALMHARLAEPMTAYELCIRIFGTRLSIHQLRFALSETLAHLFYLQALERIREEQRDGISVFRAC
ncbi:MBL fold metallo-hydrolase [Paenibacillus contaminans]|uniref:MBL fold metallo-hydrolase n=1 Tax=Paenibacillus contaminans TaxID=450362 RepID=A0A329MRU8_9BACL|nr:MBL fold metallo-hydrolase [Paenibacillus contaminans]RAV22048.1 MBL fold metallo-hydrolase [Paenibacillus contaminans]